MLKIKEISLADDEELKQWIDTPGQEITEALAVAADRVRREHYGDEVYVRGLIEFTNYCKNNCYYCCRPCLRPFQPFLQTRPTSLREEEPEL